MNTLSLVIIEDETPNANRLVRILGTIRPDYEILAVLGTVEESVQWLQTHPHPPLLLMDIRLADGICFDIFTQVDIKSAVIFTTAYDEYLMKAFKVHSVDYLLKPIDTDELTQAINKFEQFYTSVPASSSENSLNDLLALFQQQTKPYKSRFLLPYRDGYTTLQVKDIEYFYSESKLSYAHLKNGSKVLLPSSLDEIEGEVDPNIFFRANRQYIIHIDSITSIHNYFNGKLKINISKIAPIDLIISKEKSISFKSWLNR